MFLTSNQLFRESITLIKIRKGDQEGRGKNGNVYTHM